MSNARKLADNLPTEGQLSGRNVVINGNFDISQRGTSFTNIGSGGGGTSGYDDTWTMDRFLISQGQSAGRCSVEQSTDRPSGFSKSLKISTTTADTNTQASEYHRLQTKFEGRDLKRFCKGNSDAKEWTLSFYCKANAAATYTVELYDTDNSRSVSKTFSVTTDWTRVIVTFPADTTSGTGFNNDSNLSLELNWWMHAGTTYSGGTLQTTWGSLVQANRAVSTSSIFDSTSRTFFITGVQLEVGQATPFEHEPYDTSLIKCQRYYHVFKTDTQNGLRVIHQDRLTQGYIGNFFMPREMRAAPTVTQSGMDRIHKPGIRYDTISGGPNFYYIHTQGFVVTLSVTNNDVDSQTTYFGASSGGTVTADAEL